MPLFYHACQATRSAMPVIGTEGIGHIVCAPNVQTTVMLPHAATSDQLRSPRGDHLPGKTITFLVIGEPQGMDPDYLGTSRLSGIRPEILSRRVLAWYIFILRVLLFLFCCLDPPAYLRAPTIHCLDHVRNRIAVVVAVGIKGVGITVGETVSDPNDNGDPTASQVHVLQRPTLIYRRVALHRAGIVAQYGSASQYRNPLHKALSRLKLMTPQARLSLNFYQLKPSSTQLPEALVSVRIQMAVIRTAQEAMPANADQRDFVMPHLGIHMTADGRRQSTAGTRARSDCRASGRKGGSPDTGMLIAEGAPDAVKNMCLKQLWVGLRKFKIYKGRKYQSGLCSIMMRELLPSREIAAIPDSALKAHNKNSEAEKLCIHAPFRVYKVSGYLDVKS
ncbi:hypothetical protein GGX14DRAFT_401898 [Mycena pura]|uniref:Uncharacterized protein n=1 Tax=Mycena pura TaxID=153505 RepID=A0AAD6V387_9AGAR|nr:hypothetical protein GGX14DRAFT_401898 [Mycena pura]